MRTSKFLKSQRHSSSPFHSDPQDPFEFTSMELYPRIRHTAFYHQASIPEEYQNRDFEHPHNLDLVGNFSKEEHRKLKIIPPKNSEMRVIRDSYFS